MDIKTAIFKVLIVAIALAFTFRIRAARRKHRNGISTSEHSTDSSGNKTSKTGLPPGFDSTLFRLQVALLIIILLAIVLAKDVFDTDTITNILNVVFAVVVVSSSITLVTAIFLQKKSIRQRNHKSK